MCQRFWFECPSLCQTSRYQNRQKSISDFHRIENRQKNKHWNDNILTLITMEVSTGVIILPTGADLYFSAHIHNYPPGDGVQTYNRPPCEPIWEKGANKDKFWFALLIKSMFLQIICRKRERGSPNMNEVAKLREMGYYSRDSQALSSFCSKCLTLAYFSQI